MYKTKYEGCLKRVQKPAGILEMNSIVFIKKKQRE